MCGNPWGRAKALREETGRRGEARRTIAPTFFPRLARVRLLAHFLAGQDGSVGPMRARGRASPSRYTLRRRPFGPVLLDQRGRPRADRCPSEPTNRTIVAGPSAMASATGCGPAPDAPSSPAAGRRVEPACRRNRADERKRRRARPVDRPGISRRPGGSVCRARLGGGRVRGRPSRGRRGRPQPGPANPPGFVAGGRGRGPRWGRRRAGRSRNDSRGTSARAGAGGEAVALARAGDLVVTRLRRFLWVAGAPVRASLLGLIGLYRVTLSSWLGGQCRFYPTCSAYAAEAIRTHGAARGTVLAVWRLLRCGPFTSGGVDHVPPRRRPSARSMTTSHTPRS